MLFIFAQSEFILFQIDRLVRSYGIQKLLRHRGIVKRLQNLISLCITSVALQE